jgi:6-phosphogluconate dehydrogenase
LQQECLHCVPNGAGHFVEMVHNGIEYGLMASYAEGLNIPDRKHHPDNPR